MKGQIDDIAALEACIGKTPSAMHLKVIDYLDEGALRWLAASPLMFAGFGSATSTSVSLAGGRPGFVDVMDPSRIRLARSLLDSPDLAREGHGFGAVCLIPTIGETLRINGRIAAANPDLIEIKVEECYIHCAKALIRSEFWRAEPQSTVPSEAADFLAASRFLALATADVDGRSDVSPKGDPAGTMIRLSEGAITFADRPGNRRADSFRNMLMQPRVAMAALIPGTNSVASLSGEACLTSDKRLRESFSVQDKTPRLVICIERPEIVLRSSSALQRAQLWPAKAPDAVVDPAAMMLAHLKLNKEAGMQARIIRAAASMAGSVPGLMQKGLERDYKTRLY